MGFHYFKKRNSGVFGAEYVWESCWQGGGSPPQPPPPQTPMGSTPPPPIPIHACRAPCPAPPPTPMERKGLEGGEVGRAEAEEGQLEVRGRPAPLPMEGKERAGGGE